MRYGSDLDEALSALRAGQAIEICDDDDRDGEGDIAFAASAASPQVVNLAPTIGRGLQRLSLRPSDAQRLGLPKKLERQLSTTNAIANLMGFGAACPIDFHSHGVGRVDFMHLANLGLDSIETSLACEGVRAILTLYLPQHEFEPFLELMEAFTDQRAERYRHIVGIALEGPVLSSHGGTPAKGVWKPSKKQWRQIAACGAQGLQYVIVSPDAHFAGSGSDDDEPESLEWVVHSLLDGGVRPAPGHFSKADPARGAAGLERMLAIVRDHRTRPIVTDHLFNDMPLNFTHAWRTGRRRQHRAEELAAIDLPGWNRSNLRSRLGPVPALMIEAALDGLVKLCMNFDGDHVDLEISKRTIELVGAENFLLMTDRIQGQVLGGQRLTKSNENSLLYQQEGIVAGGSQFVAQQLYNMRMSGIPEHAIQQIGLTNPARVLGIEPVLGVEPEVAA